MLGKLVRKDTPLYIRGGQGKGYLAFENEDLAIELPLPFPVRGEGKLLLANGAHSILRAWSRKGAELRLGDGEIEIALGKGKAFLRAVEAVALPRRGKHRDDYPVFPATGRGPLVCPLRLARALEAAGRAGKGGEDSFVLLETTQKEGTVLRVLGTNSYVVACHNLPLAEGVLPHKGGFLSPKAALGLVPILRRMRDALEVVPCGEGLLLKGGGLKLLVRGKRDLSPGYLTALYGAVLREYKEVARLEVRLLQEALERIKKIGRSETVSLKVQEGALEVEGGSWREIIPATPLSEEGLEEELNLDGLFSILPPFQEKMTLGFHKPLLAFRKEGYIGVAICRAKD